MRSKIIYAILFYSLLVTNCSSQKELINQEASVIRWDDLQISSKTNDEMCAKISPEELDDWENIKQNFTSGLVVGFLPEDLSTPHQIANETYWVNSNEQLLFDWRFWYPEGNEKPATLRLFVLLDERQLENALPESGLYNDINLERGDDLSTKVIIPPLESGIHDLIVIGIPYPQNDPDVYGITIVVYKRITLIAEPISSPFRKIDFVSLPAEGSIKKDEPLLALELTLKHDGIDIWNWPDAWLSVNRDISTTFYALASHEYVTNLDAPSMEELETSFFAILLFVDYQQIEVAPNHLAFYGKVDKDTAYARIPLEIPPLPEGKHRIFVLRIDTPGVPYCILRGDAESRILPNSIYGKLVGLVVLPAK